MEAMAHSGEVELVHGHPGVAGKDRLTQQEPHLTFPPFPLSSSGRLGPLASPHPATQQSGQLAGVQEHTLLLSHMVLVQFAS